MGKRAKLALVALGAPTMSGCLCFSCPQPDPIAWDGRNADGSPWDGGRVTDCYAMCHDAGLFTNSCYAVTASELQCGFACAGRAPPGLAGLAPVGETLGSSLAASAEFEAAAVHAFWELAGELEAHGFSGHRAREAAYHEVRHARDTTRLALSLGHLPALPRVVPLREPRSLDAVAIDNAFEGCGRELFGAALNAWQGEHATDARVRALMREIAPDEHEHASFSRDLADALMPRLSAATRRRVREAQERALEGLASASVPEAVRLQLGLMDQAQARQLSRRLLDSARV